jgi:beta-lactamase regulating signal transducer with metallopeptidase domain
VNILDLAIKSIVVSLLGFAVFALMRKSSAATRHFTLALTLFSLCALPLVGPLIPAWHVPFIKVEAPAEAPSISPGVISAPTVPITHAVDVPSHIDPTSAVVLVWASVAAMLGLRVATRLARLRRLERQLPMSSEPELQAVVADYCRRHRRHFLLLEGESNEPPMTWGHTRPVLLLPSVARDWSADRLKSVMLHELAHVERGDWIVSLGSEIVCAMFWFNPVVWVIRKRLELESESAADDRVISMGVPRTQYASHLVELLRDLNRFPKAAEAAVAMARPGRLDTRVKAILEDRRSRRKIHGAATLGLVTLVSGMVVLVGAAGPTVIREANISIGSGSYQAVGTDESGVLVDHQKDLTDVQMDATEPEPVPDPEPKPPTPPTKKSPKSVSPHPTREVASTVSISALAPKPGTVSEPKPGATTLAVSGKPTSIKDSSDDDVSSLIPAKEIDEEIRAAQSEVRKSIQEANAEMTKEGIHLDVGALINGALESAKAGVKASAMSKNQIKAITERALKEVNKALKSMPPPTDKPQH